MKPPCHNRPPFAEGRWHFTGEWRRGKPVMRWHPRWFVDRCATHDGVGIGPNNEGYPAAHGWDCTGCRLNPRAVNFIQVSGYQNPIPDDGLRWFAVPADIIRNAWPNLAHREIDAFEPIQRAKRPSTWN